MWVQKISKSVLTLFLSLGFVSSAYSQGNLPYIDQQLFHFGFSLGMNTMDFGVTPSNEIKNDSIYDARVSTLKPGFSVGIISDLRLNRYMNLRFTPTLHFGERLLSYAKNQKYKQDNAIPINSISIQSIPICLPIYLKYSAERKGNYRPYLIWGAGMAIDLATNTDNPVLLKPVDFYTEFGVGCDIYFSFFKLAPELKYQIGFNDMFIPLDRRNAGSISEENKVFSNALSRLTSRMLTLTFNFE